MIYFDNAATTYPKPQCVYEALSEGAQKYMFNSGRGSYSAAQQTFKMIDETRQKLADLVRTEKRRVIFTSTATEALNNIINGLDLKEGDNVYISPFEHNAVIRPLYAKKVNLIFIPFDKETWGLQESELRDSMLLKKPKCVIISHISNVTGYELPYKKIFEISNEFETINILDSAQGLGIYPVDTKYINYLVFEGHKSLYGAMGIAGYYKLKDDVLMPYKIGGTGSDSLNPEMPNELPGRYEAGTLNSLAVYSINKSLDYILRENFADKKHDLTNYLISELKKLSNVEIYLPKDYISCGIVSINIHGYTSDEVGTILGEDYGICVRTGYHCAGYIHDFIDSKKYAGTVRISLSIFNDTNDIDTLINAIHEL